MDSFTEGKFASIHKFKGGIRYEISHLNELRVVFNEPIWVRYIKDGLCLDVYMHIRITNKLIVLGQDALMEGRTELPYFYRSKWSGYFQNASLLTFNDPTLYEKRGLKCGWYQMDGSMEIIQEFIDALKSKLEINEKNIVFYGASAGGYWALANSSHYNEATTVVDIPQTDLESCPYTSEIDNLRSLLGKSRLKSVFDYWSTDKMPKHIIYMHNVKDFKHIRLQLSFFLEELSQIASKTSLSIQNFSLKFYSLDDSKRGHSPLELEDTVKVLQNIIDTIDEAPLDAFC